MALMHEEAVTFPLGYGDLNQVSCGLGLGHIRDQPWNAWGHLYDMHGATGHGGSWWLRPASPVSHFHPSPMICTPAQ